MTGERKEVAVYIDLENLRYSMLNLFGQEPDFGKLVAKAKKYGRPSVMRAYADFSEHPAELRQQLHIAGIEAINVSVKRIRSERGAERVKNAADMILALDALIGAIDAYEAKKQKVFLLVTGDADYIRLVTQLRNRFEQRVVIVGVPGAIGNDLVAAAGESDSVEVEKMAPVDAEIIKRALVEMIFHRPSSLKYWAQVIIEQWAQSPGNKIPGTVKEKKDAIHGLLSVGVLAKREISKDIIGKKGNTTETYLVEEKAKELGYLH